MCINVFHRPQIVINVLEQTEEVVFVAGIETPSVSRSIPLD